MSETIALRLLDGATTTGDGATVSFIFPMFAATVQAEFPASVTAVKIRVQGLLDGATFGTLATLDTGAGYVSGGIMTLGFPLLVTKIKATVDTLTGNGSVSLYFRGRQ